MLTVGRGINCDCDTRTLDSYGNRGCAADGACIMGLMRHGNTTVTHAAAQLVLDCRVLDWPVSHVAGNYVLTIETLMPECVACRGDAFCWAIMCSSLHSTWDFTTAPGCSVYCESFLPIWFPASTQRRPLIHILNIVEFELDTSLQAGLESQPKTSHRLHSWADVKTKRKYLMEVLM